jgi:hypothetical protein
MLRQHIDFIAVLFIGAVMFAISQAPSVALPVEVKTVRLRNASLRLKNASNSEPCAIKREFLANLSDFLNQ